jgi:predicted DNA-binding transcriptional regulator AlpA
MNLHDEILTTAEASALVGVAEATLRYWRFVGTGPRSFKLGARKVAYKKSDVLDWLEAQYNAEGEPAA